MVQPNKEKEWHQFHAVSHENAGQALRTCAMWPSASHSYIQIYEQGLQMIANAWYAFFTSRIVEFFLQVWSYLSIWGPPKLPPSPSKNRKTNQPLTTWMAQTCIDQWSAQVSVFEDIALGLADPMCWKNNGYTVHHYFRCVVRQRWISPHRSTVPGILTFLVTPTAIASR